jgi:hypothetical protein
LDCPDTYSIIDRQIMALKRLLSDTCDR